MNGTIQKSSGFKFTVAAIIMLLAAAVSPTAPDLRLALRSQTGQVEVRFQGLTRINVDVSAIAEAARQ